MASLFQFIIWMLFYTSIEASEIKFLDGGGNSMLEKDIAAIFNKVAYGGVTTTKRSISSKYIPVSGIATTVGPSVTSFSLPAAPSSSTTTTTSTTPAPPSRRHTTVLPPFAAPKTSFPPAYTTPSNRELPSYVSPIRSLFTPPLPPEYANPFADKPTLRGSNTDAGLAPTNRRLPPPRPSSTRERIPLRPPDLPEREPVQGWSSSNEKERKKPLNTPSMQRPSEMVYSELDPVAAIRPSQPPMNDTDLDLVPLLHYPSVERILSSSNGRKSVEPISRMPPRMPDLFPKLEAAKPPAVRPAPPAPPEIGTERVRVPVPEPPPPAPPSPDPPAVDRAPDPVIDSATKVDQIVSNRSPEPPPPQPVPEEDEKPTSDTDATYRTKSIGNISGLAWDIHVYLAATLFSILAIHAFWNLVRITALKRLLPTSYYVTLHLLLLIIGLLRSVYLFFDAYNAGKSLPASVNNLLLNVVGPLITSAFIVLFLFLLDASKVDLLNIRSMRPALAAAFIVVHLVLCICLDLVSGWFPDRPHLRLVCQWIYIGVCAVLGASYLYVYKLFSRKVKSSFPGSECHSLAVSMRATLAVALLAILMAASQLYGVLGVNGSEAWIWWGYEFSIRVIELSISFLLLWAGMQHVRGSIDDEKESHSSGFALFRCGQCRGSSTPPGGDNNDDIYPAVCVTNQAIHDYTLRTGKKVYDDSFPLNSLHHGSYASAGDSVNPMSTGDRRSLRKAAHDGGHSSNSMDRRQKQVDSVPEIRHSTQLISLGPAGSGAVDHLMGEGLSKTADRRSLRKQAECYTDGCRSLRHPPPRASPSSMLVAENGFVRFRALAEPHAEIGTEDSVER